MYTYLLFSYFGYLIHNSIHYMYINTYNTVQHSILIKIILIILHFRFLGRQLIILVHTYIFGFLEPTLREKLT